MKFELENTTLEVEENQILSNADVYSFIQNIHNNEEDFIDGDLGKRIDLYNEFICKKIPFSKLVYDFFSYDEDIVDEYAELETETPPLFVSEYLNGNYFVEDGTHRC